MSRYISGRQCAINWAEAYLRRHPEFPAIAMSETEMKKFIAGLQLAGGLKPEVAKEIFSLYETTDRLKVCP